MRSWRSNYRGTARARKNARVSHSPSTWWRQPFTRPEEYKFPREGQRDVSSPELRPVSGSIMPSSVIRAGATRLKRLYPAIKKFPNIIFFFSLRRVVDLCQSGACEILPENRVLARFLPSNFRATVAIAIVTSNLSAQYFKSLDFNINRFFGESMTNPSRWLNCPKKSVVKIKDGISEILSIYTASLLLELVLARFKFFV